MVSESLHSERDGRSVDLTVFNCAGRLFKSTPAARRCVQCALGGSRFMCVARRAAAKYKKTTMVSWRFTSLTVEQECQNVFLWSCNLTVVHGPKANIYYIVLNCIVKMQKWFRSPKFP